MDSSGSQPLPSSRFSVLTRLGEGGMGCVYEAVDHERKARVALKTLRRLGPEEVLRFKGEFRKLQDLHHPNLVSLGELVEEHGQWFFTMELVRGSDFLAYVRSLSESPPVEGGEVTEQGSTEQPQPSPGTDAEATLRLEDTAPPSALAGSLPPMEASLPGGRCFDEPRLRGALGQLARGLHALHRAGKVHRDIKPSNILVTESGRVVLLDFGILSDVEEGEQGVVVGTAAYMAPEQARGAAPSPEADWYSVGVLLYQALTGHKPFLGSPQEVLDVKSRVDPVPPGQRVAGLPEDLCQLCEELLRRGPRQRPSGEQVLQRLGVAQEASEEAWGTLALPFVGRQAELAVLHRALEQSRAGASAVVRVQGESGVGKSRLVRRFLEEVAAGWPGAVVLAGRCYERESVPFKGVDGLIDALARYLTGRGREEAWEVVGPEAAPLARLFPVLGKVEPLALGRAQPVPVDLLQLRLSAFAALREALRRLAVRHPVVLVVDDLQWADGDSAALLDEVLRAPGLLLVATVRVATSAETGRGVEVASSRFWQQARVVELGGLPPEEAQALVERLLAGREGAEAEEVRRIARESSGHPLFIDALVRHRGGAEGEGRPWRLEEALWARACLLEPAARRLLELLAVAGGPLTQEVAAHAASLEAVDYARATASLRSARLAVTSGPAATDRVEVLHDKVRQAVVPHLEPGERRGWHTRLAASLEALRQAGAEALARHWFEAGQEARAAGYYVRAAREASEALAFSLAARLYRQALEVGQWSAEQRRQLQVARGEVLSRAGHGGEAARCFLAAAEGAGAAEVLTLQRRAGEQLLLCGHVDEALALLGRVLEAVGARYPSTEARALSGVLWQRLRLQLTSQHPRLRPPEQVPASTREQLEVFGCLAQCLGAVDPLRSFYFLSHYLRLALQAGEPRHLCRALAAEATSQALRGPGQRPRVERLMAQAEELVAQLQGEEALLGFVSAMRATQHMLLGDLVATRGAFERAQAVLERCQQAWGERSLAWEAGSYCLAIQGDLLHLGRRMQLALSEARERGDRRTHTALVMTGGFLLRLFEDEPAHARQLLDEAMAQWTQQGYHVQHFTYLASRVGVLLYEGEGEVARRLLAGEWPRLERSRLLSFPFIRMVALDVRARAGVVAARQAGAGAQALLRAVEKDIRGLERLGLGMGRALAVSLRAAVAEVRGQPETVALYEQAVQCLESAGAHLYAEAHRLRYAAQLGGEQGRQHAARARAWMEQQGIRQPERVEAMLTAGPRA